MEADNGNGFYMFLGHNQHTQKFACYLKKENNELRLLDDFQEFFDINEDVDK